MQCLECGRQTVCIESRHTESGMIRRRRECQRCLTRFTTLEYRVLKQRGVKAPKTTLTDYEREIVRVAEGVKTRNGRTARLKKISEQYSVSIDHIRRLCRLSKLENPDG